MGRRRKRRAEASSATVQRGEARLDQTDALEQLLAPLPESSELRPRLTTPLFVRAWHADTQRDYWVVSDGARVVCFTVSGLTLQQAAAVRVRWDAKRTLEQLNEESLAEIISKQTGALVTLVS